MENLKRNDTNEFIYKTDSQTQKMNLRLSGSWGERMGERDSQAVWEGHIHTAVFKMDNQQGPTV